MQLKQMIQNVLSQKNSANQFSDEIALQALSDHELRNVIGGGDPTQWRPYNQPVTFKVSGTVNLDDKDVT